MPVAWGVPIVTPFIQGVLWTTGAALLATVTLAAYIVYSKGTTKKREHAEGLIQASWRAVFAKCVQGADIVDRELPPLTTATRRSCMSLWLYWLSMLEGDARSRLIRLGIRLKLHHQGYAMLRTNRLEDTLVALEVLGMLRYKKGMAAIQAVMQSDNPELSLIAARALLHSKSRRSWDAVLAEIARTPKWGGARIEALLTDARLSDDVVVDLWRVAQKSSSERCASLLRVIASLNPVNARPILHLVLKHPQRFNSRVVTAALKGITTTTDTPLVRPFLAHKRSHVRMAAATALGGLGTTADVDLIKPLLNDKAWWTRVRAGEAIIRLLRDNKREILKLAEDLSDPYGKDALRLAHELYLINEALHV